MAARAAAGPWTLATATARFSATTGDQLAQAERFAAEVEADQRIALVRGVALIEDEVDHFQDRVEPRRQFGAGGHFERQAAVADLALGAHQTLRDGGIVGQKRAR